MVASAVDALGISGGDDPDREVRARGDVATIISELVRAGADVNAPARLARPRVDGLVTDLAYPRPSPWVSSRTGSTRRRTRWCGSSSTPART